MKLLEIDKVSAYYGRHAALNELSLRLEAGSFTALLGPNGAGKSTLLRIMAGLQKPAQGSLRWSPQKPRLGYLPEERGLYPHQKVAEQLIYMGRLRGMSRSEAQAAVEYWLERLDIRPLAKRKPGQISKGQAQKVQFAMALLAAPSFLILDEPFSGFDPLASATIQAIIAEQHKKGTTLLMATHRLETAEALCSHTALLHQGRILRMGPTQALLENERGPQALRRYFLAQLNDA